MNPESVSAGILYESEQGKPYDPTRRRLMTRYDSYYVIKIVLAWILAVACLLLVGFFVFLVLAISYRGRGQAPPFESLAAAGADGTVPLTWSEVGTIASGSVVIVTFILLCLCHREPRFRTLPV